MSTRVSVITCAIAAASIGLAAIAGATPVSAAGSSSVTSTQPGVDTPAVASPDQSTTGVQSSAAAEVICPLSANNPYVENNRMFAVGQMVSCSSHPAGMTCKTYAELQVEQPAHDGGGWVNASVGGSNYSCPPPSASSIDIMSCTNGSYLFNYRTLVIGSIYIPGYTSTPGADYSGVIESYCG